MPTWIGLFIIAALVTLTANTMCTSPETWLLRGGCNPGFRKTSIGQLQFFLFFVKVGSIVFGNGYVLLAFLQSGLIGHWHLTDFSNLLAEVGRT